MLKKLALATAALALITSTASADYYIVQEKATKKCKVVETRPTETTWIQIGPAAQEMMIDQPDDVESIGHDERIGEVRAHDRTIHRRQIHADHSNQILSF